VLNHLKKTWPEFQIIDQEPCTNNVLKGFRRAVCSSDRTAGQAALLLPALCFPRQIAVIVQNNLKNKRMKEGGRREKGLKGRVNHIVYHFFKSSLQTIYFFTFLL